MRHDHGRIAPLFFLRELHGQANSSLRHARRLRREDRRLRRLGHAGGLRLADRGAPCSAPRRRHVRCLAHVPGRCRRRRCARVPQATRRKQRRQADAVRQGAVRLHAERRRRRHRRSHHLLPARRLVPRRRQCIDGREGPGVDGKGAARRRLQADDQAAARSGHDRRAGAERTRQVLAGSARDESRDRRPGTVLRRRGRANSSSHAPATPAKTASRSCCRSRRRRCCGRT